MHLFFGGRVCHVCEPRGYDRGQFILHRKEVFQEAINGRRPKEGHLETGRSSLTNRVTGSGEVCGGFLSVGMSGLDG
jgi:hypothetical protein